MTRDETAPSDAPDNGAAIDSYEALAESFVMGMHNRIKGLQDDAPASLIALDKHFWREDYSRKRDKPLFEEQLLAGLGAFVGQVLVNELDGVWVPHAARRLTRVIVGDYSYAPFARAEQYLTSKQAVLDYAMCKLYRVAARASA